MLNNKDREVRPTFGTLGSLGIEIPKLPSVPYESEEIYRLCDLQHPIIDAANITAQRDFSSLERINLIDDNSFYKCKTSSGRQQWRGVIWNDNRFSAKNLFWVVKAGIRKEDSREDFYKSLERECVAQRKKLNLKGLSHRKNTSSEHLLPTHQDYERLEIESKFESLKMEFTAVKELLELAKENIGMTAVGRSFDVQIEITVLENNIRELYVAIKPDFWVPLNTIVAILRAAVPDSEIEDWGLEQSETGVDNTYHTVYYTFLEMPGLS